MIRDAAYEALPKATRAELHERFSDWLTEHGGDLVELDEILGYHLEQAYRYREELGIVGGRDEELARRAAQRLSDAGGRSAAIGDARGAVNLLQRAAALTEPQGREGVELLLRLGDALFDAGELQAARERLGQAVAVAQKHGDHALGLRARCEFAMSRVIGDPSFTAEEAIELGRSAVRELESSGDDLALAAAWHLVSAGCNLRAHWQGVADALEPAIEHARRGGDRKRERDALVFWAVSMFWGPTPVSTGLPRVERLLERTESKMWVEGWLSRMVGGFYGMQGRFDEARQLMAHARSTLEDLGRPLDVSTMAFWTGPLELLAGNPLAAERELGAACDVLDGAGERGWLSTMASMHAEALYALDRLDDAETAARRSREAATSDDYNAQALWRSTQAKVLAIRGEAPDAEELAREAVAIIDRTDEINHQADVRRGFAEVLRLAGRAEEARSQLEQALELYEQKGNVVMAERARALLDS